MQTTCVRLGQIEIGIIENDVAISFLPHGHGDFSSVDGQGCPFFIEFYQGSRRSSI